MARGQRYDAGLQRAALQEPGTELRSLLASLDPIVVEDDIGCNGRANTSETGFSLMARPLQTV
jgi:hypothetical protein